MSDHDSGTASTSVLDRSVGAPEEAADNATERPASLPAPAAPRTQAPAGIGYISTSRVIRPRPSAWWRAGRQPGDGVAISVIGGALVVALGVVAMVIALLASGGFGPRTASTGTSSSTGGSTMNMGSSGSSSSSSTNRANVPNATQWSGGQPAKYTLDADGAKHFTLTAQQVMWEVVKGQRVLAWTLDGTVPGPMIHVTAGDHVRITIVNHLPEATTIHWHGLEVPTDNDGVPPIGMKPIEPGQSYTYDFTLNDQDAGTHWYHSHFDDLIQVGGGMYGAFIVDARPGSPQAQQTAQYHADVDETLFIGMLGSYYVIDGHSFPDTAPIQVKHGQTVRLRFIGADVNLIHPMHLHGHTMTVIAEDGHMLAQPYQKDTLAVAPGETYDVVFNAWAAPGSIYPLHCHILSHLMNPGQSAGEMGGLVDLVEYAK